MVPTERDATRTIPGAPVPAALFPPSPPPRRAARGALGWVVAIACAIAVLGASCIGGIVVVLGVVAMRDLGPGTSPPPPPPTPAELDALARARGVALVYRTPST